MPRLRPFVQSLERDEGVPPESAPDARGFSGLMRACQSYDRHAPCRGPKLYRKLPVEHADTLSRESCQIPNTILNMTSPRIIRRNLEECARTGWPVETVGVEAASEVGRLRTCYTLGPSLNLPARFPEDGASSGR